MKRNYCLWAAQALQSKTLFINIQEGFAGVSLQSPCPEDARSINFHCFFAVLLANCGVQFLCMYIYHSVNVLYL